MTTPNQNTISRKEVRFVFDRIPKAIRSKINTEQALDWTDYYISRSRRLRQFENDSHSNACYFIEAEPGTQKKLKSARISDFDLDHLLEMNKVVFTIVKRGIGTVLLRKKSVEGYVEKVIAWRKNKKRLLFEEIHIEFEQIPNVETLLVLIRILEPRRVFQKGLFDYCTNYLSKKLSS